MISFKPSVPIKQSVSLYCGADPSRVSVHRPTLTETPLGAEHNQQVSPPLSQPDNSLLPAVRGRELMKKCAGFATVGEWKEISLEVDGHDRYSGVAADSGDKEPGVYEEWGRS